MQTNVDEFEYSSVAARLPAQDLERARRFYSEKLAWSPTRRAQADIYTFAQTMLSGCSPPMALHLAHILRWDWK